MRVRLQFDDQALELFYEFFYIWKKLVFLHPVFDNSNFAIRKLSQFYFRKKAVLPLCFVVG